MVGRYLFWIGLFLFCLGVQSTSSTFGKTCSSTSNCGSSGYVCSNQSCSYCGNSAECEPVSQLYVCEYDTSEKGDICKHKNLIPDVSYIDVLVSLALFMGGCLAAGGGIGGGGVFVPLLILIGKFSTTDAIPLSNVLIGGASVANFIQMFRRRNPIADRPLIDYNLALMLQPLCLGGTIIGVILNTLFPNWLILLLLVIVLCITVHRTTVKGVALWKRERQTIPEEILPEDKELPLAPDKPDNGPDPLKDILEKEKKTPRFPILVMVSVLVLTSMISIMKGSGTSTSIAGVQPCSATYWLLSVISIPILVVIESFVAFKLIRVHKIKDSIAYEFQSGDVKWTRNTSVITAAFSFVAGILASLLGIGGGMVLGPLMLELHVLPEVTAATSSFMILFTSTAAIVQYVILGRLIFDYSMWFLLIGFACSLAGQIGLTRFVKKYKKTSVIVLVISLVISISTVLLVVVGVINLVADIKAGVSIGFHSLC